MSFFWGTVCPILGVVVSNIQLATPFRAVLSCREKGTLGDLNPIPWAVSFTSCTSWMIYGCARQDAYLMTSVSIGVLANAYSCFTALQLLVRNDQPEVIRQMENVLLVGMGIWILIGYFVGVVAKAVSTDADELSIEVMGALCSAVTILYYISPLTKIVAMIRQKDVTSLHLPMLVMNMVASFLWSSYGIFGRSDMYLFASSAFSFLVTLIMVTVKLIFYNVTVKSSVDEESGNGIDMNFSKGDYSPNTEPCDSLGVKQSGSTNRLAKMILSSPDYDDSIYEEIASGIRRRGSSIGEFASKVLGFEATPNGFVSLPAESKEHEYDYDNEPDYNQGRSRRSSSVAEMASAVLMTTLDVLAVAPPDSRSSIGTIG